MPVLPSAPRAHALRAALSLTSLAALLALSTVDCSSKDAASEPTPTSDAGSDGVGDAPSDAADALPGAIAVPASTGSWTAPGDLTIEGRGSGALGAISLSHGVGTLTFDGAPAKAFYFVGSAVPLGTDAGVDSALAQERDFEILAEQDGRLIAAWLTCYQGGLYYVYYETTDGLASKKSQTASGTCSYVETPVGETPAWPAFSFPPPSLVSGFTIAGAEIAYDGQSPGSIALNGDRWSLHPFHLIDCTACATPGWWELHSILWDPTKQRSCFGILYLQQSAPAQVELAYLTCFPDVTSPIPYDQKLYAATWTHP